MITQKKKISSWMKDHSFEIGTATVFTLAFAGIIVASIMQADAIAEEIEKQNNWEKSQLEQGNTIIEKDDHLYAVKVVSVY